jgi:hypothetical protein
VPGLFHGPSDAAPAEGEEDAAAAPAGGLAAAFYRRDFAL